MTLILGIETSCDETAAAVVTDGCAVRSNIIASQHHLHEKYGGVVPEIASRAHLQRIVPVLEEALAQAGVAFEDLDAIAVGNRPGLIGSLLVGVSAAKALAWALSKPLIGVDHVRAHLYAGFLKPLENSEAASPSLEAVFPAVGLVVSGGHSSLFRVDDPLRTTLLGRTIDDAVGEAYDKAAVMLDLGYPGGPLLDKLAQRGNPRKFDLPRSLLGPESLDFSFSGLKTALLYSVRGQPRGKGREAAFERSAADLSEADKRDLAAAFQEAAIDALIVKVHRAIDTLTRDGAAPRSLLLGGGVSANSLLRRRAVELTQRGLRVYLPPMDYCLDNAAMIAGLAHHQLHAGQVDDLALPVIATASL